MARKKGPGNKPETEVKDYRHEEATRKNNPPAGIASHAKIRETPKREYAYNPHLPPAAAIRRELENPTGCRSCLKRRSGKRYPPRRCKSSRRR